MSELVSRFPAAYSAIDREPFWAKHWIDSGVFKANLTAERSNTFIVDTPPPTVSGELHMGHIFSYTQTDVVVRYQRMQGKAIVYPMGWDDNGLPTERRVQNVFGITCDPNQPTVDQWKPTLQTDAKAPAQPVSRHNFIEACNQLTQEDEKAFESLWKRVGLSVDWSLTYATIGDHARKTAQWSFLDLVEKNHIYQAESPTMWDVTFKTAVAQAELEDRPLAGHYHDILFQVEGQQEPLMISTTRPELLAACIAVVAHPSDARYTHLFGKKAITPLFEAQVPILASDHADPEKGTGVLMVCTFGDGADVDWWKTSGLPLKAILGRDGRLQPLDFSVEPFLSLNPEKATLAYTELQGLSTKQARKRIAELLLDAGAMVGEPKSTERPVKFYEKGVMPIEFLTTRQWFIRLLPHKAELLEKARQVQWHPAHMVHRIEHWIEGLSQDWCISRQRFFGVPFPVWYPLNEQAEPCYDKPIFATKAQLPLDPNTVAPAGYSESQRNQALGFMADPDVMDTWATSSLTPQLISNWVDDPNRHTHLFPMDLRPQAHEIIRTWAFYTLAKAWMHDNQLPWKHVAISGWILDPDRKKMSKSKGNVVTPAALLDSYSADAVRYWACRAGLGNDTIFDESVFKIGQKLATKLFNVAKFMGPNLDRAQNLSVADITHPLDQAFLKKLLDVVTESPKHFEAFAYATVLEAAEKCFWDFCDYYVELVKGRSYRETLDAESRSALATLRLTLGIFLRLFAPYMPFITEEIWSWFFASQSQSVHQAQWPSESEFPAFDGIACAEDFEFVTEVLSVVRGQKTQEKRSLKWGVDRLEIPATPTQHAFLMGMMGDLSKTTLTAAENIVFVSKGNPFSVVLAKEVDATPA
ncbi:MAG: valine--tRNA ligase [Candidatus Margulisiibacteriota bacterium]